MKCDSCPGLIDCSNEDVGHETACWFGDVYQDENCIEYKDGSYGCNKTKEEIEADMQEYENWIQSKEYEEQLQRDAELFEYFTQNYDFERGDVIY